MNPKDENHVMYEFDSYCKKVLKYAARDSFREQRQRGKREVPFSELSKRELSGLVAFDDYSIDETIFDVQGEAVSVNDSNLADALGELSQDKRDIVLLSYFMGMTDREIAECMDMARRTVAHRRINSLRELKRILEENENV